MNRLIFVFLLFSVVCLQAQYTLQPVVVGAERTGDYLPLLQGKRIALVVNHTSLIGNTHLADSLQHLGVNIKAIFAPEHGFRGSAEAGETIKDGVDTKSGIPVISIYGKKKQPSAADLAEIDLVAFDIQDVGVRFYTYISTMYYLMEACGQYHKPLLVLDRPNPNGHLIDGPVLESGYTSFVGIAPLPIAHGCTVGELAQLFKGEHWTKYTDSLALTVIACQHYTHHTRYAPPVRPSPNLPDIRSILLYPSICLFEGTKVSVGRGTERPFQIFGYPDCPIGQDTFTPHPNGGSKDPPHKNLLCTGYDLVDLPLDSLYARHEIDLHWLLNFFEKSPRKDDFFLKNNFFNLLAGNSTLRIQVEQGDTAAQIRASWQPGLVAFKEKRKQYLIYE